MPVLSVFNIVLTQCAGMLAENGSGVVTGQLGEFLVGKFNTPLPVTDQNGGRALLNGLGKFPDFSGIFLLLLHIRVKPFAHLIDGIGNPPEFIMTVCWGVRAVQGERFRSGFQ